MTTSKQIRIKRFFSLIFSLMLCMSVFSVLDRDALDAFAAVTIKVGNTGISNQGSTTAAVSYSITSDPDNMITSFKLLSSKTMYSYTIADNLKSTSRSATVKLYNTSGQCVNTITFLQDATVLKINKTSPDNLISYDGDAESYYVEVTANCRLYHTGTTSNVKPNAKSKEGISMNKSGTHFGTTMGYGKTYTVSVEIVIPNRIQHAPAKGQAYGATGSGYTFIPEKGCRYISPVTFSYGQQSAKVQMKYSTLFKSYTLTGQVPYPGTEPIYDLAEGAWFAVYLSSFTIGFDLSQGITVKYASSYTDSTNRVVTGKLCLYYPRMAEAECKGWVDVGVVTYSELSGTFIYRAYSSKVDPNGDPDQIPSDDKLGAEYTFNVTFK